jgi:tRNA (adenine-N(1)-)-methyltransferase non-catalytic subunit
MAVSIPVPPVDLMKEGDSVYVTGGDIHRLITLKKEYRMKLGRTANVDLGSLIGQPCGLMYEVDEAKRVLHPYTGPTNPDEADEAEIDLSEVAGKDNRHLLETNAAAQSLTHEQIEAIKATDGVKGIVDKLVQSSATFSGKTAFSQQKYIRRKKKKYLCTFIVERVTPDALTEMWCPTRRNDTYPMLELRWVRMRVDALAQMMCLGNVHANSRVMIAERTNGFLPAAVLSRLGPDGRLFQILNPHRQATMTNARNMNLPDVKQRWKCIRRVSLLNPDVVSEHPAEKQERVRWKPPAEEETAAAAANDGDNSNNAAAAASTAAEAAADDSKVMSGPAPAPEPSQWYNGKEARELFADAPCDSLMVADDSPTLPEDVAELLPFVASGATIAVYCPFLEPLCELFRQLRDDCVCMSIRDTWYREYQVLPGRCHPFVNMTHNSGYMFSAVRAERRLANPGAPKVAVAAAPAPAAVAAAAADDGAASPEAEMKRHRAE